MEMNNKSEDIEKENKNKNLLSISPSKNPIDSIKEHFKPTEKKKIAKKKVF